MSDTAEQVTPGKEKNGAAAKGASSKEAQFGKHLQDAQAKVTNVLDLEARSDDALVEVLAEAFLAYELVKQDRALLDAALVERGIKPDTVKQVPNGVIRLVFGEVPPDTNAKHELRKSQCSKYATVLRWFESQQLATTLACINAYKAEGGLESVCKAFRDGKEKASGSKAALTDARAFFKAQQTRGVVIEQEQPLFSGLDDNELFVVLAQKVGGKTVLHRVLGSDAGFDPARVKKIAQKFVPKKNDKRLSAFLEAVKFISAMPGTVYIHAGDKETVLYCEAVDASSRNAKGILATAICPAVEFLPRGVWLEMDNTGKGKHTANGNLQPLAELIAKATEEQLALSWQRFSSGVVTSPFRQHVTLSSSSGSVSYVYKEAVVGDVTLQGEEPRQQLKSIITTCHGRGANYFFDVVLGKQQASLLTEVEAAAAAATSAARTNLGRKTGTVNTAQGQKVKVKRRGGEEWIPAAKFDRWAKGIADQHKVVRLTVENGNVAFGFLQQDGTPASTIQLYPKSEVDKEVTIKLDVPSADFRKAFKAFSKAKASDNLTLRGDDKVLRLESRVNHFKANDSAEKKEQLGSNQYIVNVMAGDDTGMTRKRLDELLSSL
ncbi:hypothetical protein [Azospirillum sp. sgz301742]